MGEAIEKLKAEVDESKIKVIFSTQCIKAQTMLADKLKKQIQHHKETCGFISSSNLKLQSEIVEAEHKINSMLIAQKTINMANVELQKELLLTKERKTEINKRIESGEKKYEAMWLESKNRYEAIGHVQKLINANEKLNNTKNEILKLDEASLKLVEEIDTKTKNCADINKKRAIELAVFIVRDIPKYHKIISEKTKAIAELSEKIREFEIKVTHNVVNEEKVQANSKKADDSEWSMFNKPDEILIMPTLELPVRDFDALSAKLDKVNIKNTNTDNSNTEAKEAFPRTRFEINMFQSNNKDDLISSYFPKIMNNEVNQTENYSKKKLINILKDIKVNKDDALKMISKANRSSLAPVEAIGAEMINAEIIPNSPRASLDNKCKKPIQSEEIEEIDLTSKSEDIILNPPSPFLDMTTITITEDNFQDVDDDEQLVNSVKESLDPQVLSQQNEVASATKRVSFNLSSNIKSNEVNDVEDGINELNVSGASDDGYANIKDMVMKKHNLDISPQFVYAKNTKLQKNTENSIVTSKFFQQNENNNIDIAENEPANNEDDTEKPVDKGNSEDQPHGRGQEIQNVELNVDDDDDTAAATSPKRRKIDDPQSVKPVSGLIFNHGAHPIIDSLDLSFSTTGYEEDDNDFPHCVDSSVLLSPKANIIPSPSGDNTEVSQEVPNFLSGLRKTGLSFFGRLPTSESKPDSNTVQNAGSSSGFSFNFGSKDEKKARGGLFSMFQ